MKKQRNIVAAKQLKKTNTLAKLGALLVLPIGLSIIWGLNNLNPELVSAPVISSLAIVCGLLIIKSLKS